jgi:hypothetical protein
MELGLDAPEALEALQRCLEVIADIEERYFTLPANPAELGQPGSDIAGLVSVLPDPPVDIRLTMLAAATSSQACLGQVRRFVVHQLPTSPVVLATLCRTALMASSRLLVVVGPHDERVRRANAIRVLLQESESIQRCYKKAASFTQLGGLVPPADVLAQQGRRHQHLKSIAKSIRETDVLDEAASIIGDLLRTSAYQEPNGLSQLNEHFSWTFNVYSGVAHGFGWPRLVPGTQSLPGDFTSELLLTVSVCHIAIDRLQQAHQAPRAE